jgi:RIO kinase 1
MSPENQQAIVEGQFNDAPSNDVVVDDQQDPRTGGHFIDDEHPLEVLEWSDESSEAGDGDEGDFEDDRADDEDWEVAERGELHLHS